MTAHLDYKDTINYLDNKNYMPAYDGQILNYDKFCMYEIPIIYIMQQYI